MATLANEAPVDARIPCPEATLTEFCRPREDADRGDSSELWGLITVQMTGCRRLSSVEGGSYSPTNYSQDYCGVTIGRRWVSPACTKVGVALLGDLKTKHQVPQTAEARNKKEKGSKGALPSGKPNRHDKRGRRGGEATRQCERSGPVLARGSTLESDAASPKCARVFFCVFFSLRPGPKCLNDDFWAEMISHSSRTDGKAQQGY